MLDTYPQVRPGPPRPSSILTPLNVRAQAGQERYEVPGAGAFLIPVTAGDRLTIRNAEGGQVCEVLAADAKGAIDAGVIGAVANSTAPGLKALLGGTGSGMGGLRLGLTRRGIDLAQAGAVALFETTTPAGTEESFTVTRAGVVVVAAPGLAMAPDAQDTATPLIVTVQRATVRLITGHDLPDPLADPVLDLRIKSATAQAYFVKAGDYIQVLDVDGRQCTDFQCFSARKLDKGIEHALDVTTSRTLMGHAYSMPGLHAKYYDQDWLPLIEVVQDTVGRHDAFAMACASKYYDDIGYPGHVNCSDNFNRALADHGVTARPGWMAVNLFFNTNIDAHGVLISDEPWSRPGDYVLFRALTDLICVSSACPDDTSPANGWYLSDIHVRTYDGAEKFSRAIAYRPTPDAEPKMTKETAFHTRTEAKTRHMVEYKGYWLPHVYSSNGAIEEYWACREKAVVLDLSPLRKFEVTGPDAEALMQYTLTRDVKKLSVGQVVYSAMCYEHGGMIDDGTLFRLGKDQFRWIGGDDYGGVWLREQAEKLGLQVMVRASTDQLHNLAVQGPNSREIMRRMIWTAPHQPTIEELGWFRFTVGRLGGPDGAPVVVSRTGYTGELGFEVFCHPKDGAAVYDAVWEHGADQGLRPMGLAALDMVRIEAGLIFAGYDFSDQTDPFEAGIGFTVLLKSKTDDFIGRDALIRRKEHAMHKFVGLDIDANVDVGHGDCIHVGRAQIGVVTSSMRSPLLGKNIALARVDVAHAAVGTAVEVGKLDGQQKRLPAVIVPLSHYDPKKTRPQS
ncbi:aminomethyltransferase family protein [Gemmobacter fulvus]|uniref:Aminomethyltransferase family protein n=1 Tax=Gemmobacter fulvus TaxID=2840474 RepID=A0A975P7D3_9RHOB|nr:aminomethyltransferase family protein [Gemmobacter fulvus]MBT9244052.1 aminomethyltransferase family protein [Gemmobacter fulvus]QWK90960.1 aminomethyltransferase family protein [Gemmobacter fulvus]